MLLKRGIEVEAMIDVFATTSTPPAGSGSSDSGSPGGSEATPAPTSAPTATLEPTNTPVAAATPAPAMAWLEPDPETMTFDGSGWQGFTVRGARLEYIDFSVNVVNFPDGPSSTGRVARSTRSSPPTVSDACRNAGYAGYTVSTDDTFSLAGCRTGTVIIQLAHYVGSDYVLLRRYTVNVSGGP